MKYIISIICTMFIAPVFADTETINWYVDGNVYNTSTCQSGGNVTLPATAPTKRGHTFVGWEVALYDFSTLDTSIDGTTYNYSETNKTWNTTFPYGIIYGRALCSKTSGSFAVAGTPDESGNGVTRYCWCMASTYKNTSNNVIYEPTSSLSWVFSLVNDSAFACASFCAAYCGDRVRYNSNFRRAVFGVTQ